MTQNEKGRPGEGSPIPNYVLADKSEPNSSPLNLQVALLTRRFGFSPATAQTVAPHAFGEAA